MRNFSFSFYKNRNNNKNFITLKNTMSIVAFVKTSWALSSIGLIGKGYYDLIVQHNSKKH